MVISSVFFNDQIKSNAFRTESDHVGWQGHGILAVVRTGAQSHSLTYTCTHAVVYTLAWANIGITNNSDKYHANTRHSH